MIKFVHTGDCHITHGKQFDDSIKSLRFICENSLQYDPDFFVIAGDFWHTVVKLNQNSPVMLAVKLLKEYPKPIVMIRGNHDEKGSLDIFKEISDNIYVSTEPEIACLNIDTGKIEKFSERTSDNLKTIFYCLPYIDHHSIIYGDPDANRGENTIDLYVRNILMDFKTETKDFDCPKIIIAHGAMKGYVECDGQSSEEIGTAYDYTEKTFRLAEVDYVALAHIHKFQTFMDGRACYCSSIYSINFKELDKKSYSIITIDKENNKFSNLRKEIPITRRHRKEINYDDFKDYSEFRLQLEKDYHTMNDNTHILFEYKIISIPNVEIPTFIRNTKNITIKRVLLEISSTENIEIYSEDNLIDKAKQWTKSQKIDWDDHLDLLFNTVEKEFAELDISEDDV